MSVTFSPAIEICDLAYNYRSNWTLAKTPALSSFSLSISAGEAFGFLGHNGSGKTTAIKCILGLLKPSAGSIKIFGVNSLQEDSRLAVGYVPEYPYFYDNLSVFELMQMYAALSGVPKRERQDRIAEVLHLLKISARAKSSMRALSKGLMQRVALAQALLGKPKLLVLDEPFSGLDPIGRREFREIFVELKKTGTSIFICSHILSDVEFFCDRVSILVRGEMKGVFRIADLPRLVGASYELVVSDASQIDEQLSKHALEAKQSMRISRYCYTSKSHAEQALRISIDHGVGVESYQMLHGSLEELFVKLVGDTETR